MKKIFLFILLSLILFSFSFGSEAIFSNNEANFVKVEMEFNGVEINGYNVVRNSNLDIKLNKGWNLVMSSSDLLENEILDDSELTLDDISIAYSFFPVSKLYLQVYPQPSHLDLNNLTELDIAAFQMTPTWIYSNKAGVLKKTNKEYTDIFPLFKGWNLFVINDFLNNYTLNNFSGNCNFKYVNEFLDNDWISFNINKKIGYNDLGKGLSLYVENDCLMSPPIKKKTIINLSKEINDYTILGDNLNIELIEKCIEIEEKDFCYKTTKVQYINDNNDSVWIAYFVGDKESFKKMYNIEKYKEVKNGVFEIEPHELLWFPSEGFDMIFTQQAKYEKNEYGGKTYNYDNGYNLNDPLLKKILKENNPLP